MSLFGSDELSAFAKKVNQTLTLQVKSETTAPTNNEKPKILFTDKIERAREDHAKKPPEVLPHK